MRIARDDILATALADPRSVTRLDVAGWEELIRRAREANVLGVLAARIDERSLGESLPAAPRAHLVAARIRGEAQVSAIRRELAHLARSLADVDTPVVLLKGAAYLCANLSAARGRTFSDVDILVPKARLGEVESAFMQAGFVTTHTEPYDQRYYRKWMHELPPMLHLRRRTVLDIHHALVPETSRMHPDSTLLLEEALPLDEAAWRLGEGPYDELATTMRSSPGSDREAGSSGPTRGTGNAPRFHILAPADMTIHCATHLFCDEDFDHAPRDLVDFDGLVREFGARAGFWEMLVARARRLDLARPLAYALHWSARIHRTPVPPEVLRDACADLPLTPLRQVMNALLGPALGATRGRASTRWARRALYVRGHWLKMPPHLLAWHLTVKALRREKAPEPEDAPGEAA